MNAAHASHSHATRTPSWPLYALIAVTATALALLTTAQAGVALVHEGQAVPWAGLLKARLVDWYACALFMPVLLALVRRYPIRCDTWAHHLPVLLLASVPIAVAKEVIFVAVGNYFRPGVFDLTTLLSEDLSYEVMAVWSFLAVAQVLVSLQRETAAERTPESPPLPAAVGASTAFIDVPTPQGLRRVPIAEIEYVDAHGNYARLVTSRGRYLVRETMARLGARLGSAFLRVHRSVIVRRDRIVKAESAKNGCYWLELASGARLRTGRSYRDAVRLLSESQA